MTLLDNFTQYGVFSLSFFIFLHAIKIKKFSVFIFLLLDAFIFEYFILKLYTVVIYNPNLINTAGIPLIVVFGWTVLLYSHIFIVKSHNPLFLSVYTALSLTLIDLVLEYPAVILGIWRWTEPSGYFGVPYKNFFAWFVYSFLVAFFIPKLAKGISLYNFLIVFIQITFLGLVIGFLWNLLPLTMQKISFWSLIAMSTIILLKHWKKIVYDMENIYLLLIPAIFYSYSLFLLFFITLNSSALIKLSSFSFFVFWIILNTMVIINSVYATGIHKQRRNSRSSLFE